MDCNDPLPTGADESDAVEVPDTDCPLCDADQAELQRTISPFGPSENYGIDLYLATLSYVQQQMYIH